MMTSLNGLRRTWDYFIQTVCAKKDKLQFDSLWEECVKEEERVANKEAILREDEDQYITSHTNKGRGKRETHFHKENHSHKEPHSPKKFQKYQKGQRRKRDFSSYKCYHCERIGPIAKNFPLNI
jgi:hypothetical protein